MVGRLLFDVRNVVFICVIIVGGGVLFVKCCVSLVVICLVVVGCIVRLFSIVWVCVLLFVG